MIETPNCRGKRLRVDVGAFIDATPFGSMHVVLTVLCASVALLDGYDTLAIAYAAPAITEQWHQNASLFGPIFAAHLLGGVIGGALIGMLADRRGRRIALVAATLLFGVAALMTALATNFTQLFICRLLTGAGLAGALANAISLAAEYAPKGVRATVVSAMFCAFPLGGALSGIVSAKLIEAWGWPSVFWLGGALPIALACPLMIIMPESTKFLVATSVDRVRIAGALNRLVPVKLFRGDETFVLAKEAASHGSVWEIFSAPYGRKTLLLWIAFGVNQIALTFAITWMPLVLRQSGAPLSQSIVASAFYTLACHGWDRLCSFDEVASFRRRFGGWLFRGWRRRQSQSDRGLDLSDGYQVHRNRLEPCHEKCRRHCGRARGWSADLLQPWRRATVFDRRYTSHDGRHQPRVVGGGYHRDRRTPGRT